MLSFLPRGGIFHVYPETSKGMGTGQVTIGILQQFTRAAGHSVGPVPGRAVGSVKGRTATWYSQRFQQLP